MSAFYTDVTDPKWGDSAKTQIHCMVKFADHAMPLPFNAMANDPYGYGRQIWLDLNAGKYGPIGDYVPVVQTLASALGLGLVLTCAASPGVDGTYAVTDAALAGINSEAQFISLYQEFSTGTTSRNWPDSSGIEHTFPDTATFMAFAKEALRYVALCRQAQSAASPGSTPKFPSNVASI